jgi:chromosome partitioning protein
MRTIAVGIQKGGVGKTSISVSLAAVLAKHHKTLLLDLDSQGQASFWAVMKPDGSADLHGELEDVLFGTREFSDVLCPTFRDNLFCIPTYGGKEGRLDEYADGKGQKNLACIKKVITSAAGQDFEFCIIDLSPHFGAMERSSYIAADEVITPIIPDPLSVDGFQIFAEKWAELRDNLSPLGIKIADYKRMIVNAVNKSYAYHKEFLSDVKKTAKMEVFVIPQDRVFSRASSLHCGIEEAGAKEETLKAINQIARRLENAA